MKLRFTENQSKTISSISFSSLALAVLLTTPTISAKQNQKSSIATNVKLWELPAAYHAKGRSYAVATQGKHTSLATEKVLKEGGNAVDAFVTASLMISVERPQSTGIGGGGFLVYKDSKTNRVYAFDFREQAPLRARRDMFLNEKGKAMPTLSRTGILSGAVPGLVAGVYDIHKRFGKLPWSRLVKPAVELARNGFTVNKDLFIASERSLKRLKKDKEASRIFLTKDLKPLPLGTTLYQKDLANTLDQIAKTGKTDFYYGNTAKKIVAHQKQHHGRMTLVDLQRYQTIERQPVKGTFDHYDIYTMPPPSSGGVHLVQMLKMLDSFKIFSYPVSSQGYVHLMASVMQRAYADRATHMGDMDYETVPINGLIEDSYLSQRMKNFDPQKAKSAAQIKSGNPTFLESDHTTHFTIADKHGNIASSTQTINGYFGSHMVIPGTGIVLNNEMDDFSAKPGASNLFGAIGSSKNSVQPGKRPLSSMTPTIVFEKNKLTEPKLALGSPSGTQIINCVFQTVVNVLELGLDLRTAMQLPRFHHQWQPDYIKIEPDRLPKTAITELNKMGYKVKEQAIGCKVQAISWLKEGGMRAVSDPRGEGSALAN